ncbi:MAG: hypothetical protein DMG27_19605, partial [Acidobacteria bacterium]
RDAASLARLIVDLYGDLPLRRRLGENGIKTARQLTWDRNVAELQRLFEETMEHSGSASL